MAPPSLPMPMDGVVTSAIGQEFHIFMQFHLPESASKLNHIIRTIVFNHYCAVALPWMTFDAIRRSK